MLKTSDYTGVRKICFSFWTSEVQKYTSMDPFRSAKCVPAKDVCTRQPIISGRTAPATPRPLMPRLNPSRAIFLCVSIVPQLSTAKPQRISNSICRQRGRKFSLLLKSHSGLTTGDILTKWAALKRFDILCILNPFCLT